MTFSKKYGFSSPPPVTFRHDAPEWLRYAIVTAAREAISFEQIRTVVCTTLMVPPDRNNWSTSNIRDEIHSLMETAEWYHVYDVVEQLVSFIEGTCGYDQVIAFADKINEIFVDIGAGWQIQANAGIVIRGDAHFEDAVQSARASLSEAGFSVADRELNEALRDISRRPTPDLTGAIHHAFGAIESVARYVHNSEKTFGEIVKLLDIPKPLDAALEKLWGYSSNYARHVSPTNVPNLVEATLVVHLSSAICRFLVDRKQ